MNKITQTRKAIIITVFIIIVVITTYLLLLFSRYMEFDEAMLKKPFVPSLIISVAPAILFWFFTKIHNLLYLNIQMILLYYDFFIMKYNKEIIVTVSYLFRIKVDEKYLLVYNSKYDMEMYQPVGGKYKIFSFGYEKLKELGVNFKGDDQMDKDKSTENDIRGIILGKNIFKFIEWFESGKGREISVEREFREELIQSKILDIKVFPYANVVFCDSKIFYKNEDPYHKKPIFKYFEVFDIKLNDQQTDFIRNLSDKKEKKYIKLSEREIKHIQSISRGVSTNHPKLADDNLSAIL